MRRTAHNKKKDQVSKNSKGSTTSLRRRFAENIVSLLCGDVKISSPLEATIAGSIVFWYLENGVRHFIMVKEQGAQENARFVSCLGLGKHKDISVATQETTKLLLGEVFYRALDQQLLKSDRVAAVPAFKCESAETGEFFPVHSIVWTVQITPEQAQLCEPQNQNIEVISIPEFAIMGPEVSASHKQIYQAVLRHIHGSSPIANEAPVDLLEDLLNYGHTTDKIIH